MLDDIVFKLGRKFIPLSIYRGISKSVFGRDGGWKKIGTYAATFAFYQGKMGDVTGKKILEVGSGDQYFTALFFLAAGAAEVHLIEPKIRWDEAKFARESEEFKRLNPRSPGAEIIETAKDRIYCYRDITEIPADLDGSFDVACSYLVLEHIPDLGLLFGNIRRLLRTGGAGYHLVDLSDHTYHVFAKYPVLRKLLDTRYLYHLRYSDRLFDFINDTKTYMNRRLFPEYEQLLAANAFTARALDKQVFENTVVHGDLRRRHPNASLADLKVLNFYLEFQK